MNELIVKYKVATCHYIYSNYVMQLYWVILIISDLRSQQVRELLYPLDVNW